MFLSLQKNFFLWYVMIIILIITIISIVIYIRYRAKQFEYVISEANVTCDKIYKSHLSITELITLGESVIIWNELDYNRYHLLRIRIDSVLLDIKSDFVDYVNSEQIDSLRILLEVKENHLFRIMEAVQSWENTDSSLIKELPFIANKAIRFKTITRKKKGLAGLFGKTETVQVPYYSNEIIDINEKFTSIVNKRNCQIKNYVDSLLLQNKFLNSKLYNIILLLNNKTQQSLAKKSNEIIGGQKKLFRFFSILIIITIVSLSLYFIIIRTDLRKEEIVKLRLKQVIDENEDLLEMRKRIILTVSHDIRGPLGNIHNCADLASQTREKKKREPYLEDIRHSCHHILHLVNDLMDAYRINEAGDLRNDTPFYLDRFLQRISDEFSRKAVAKALYLQSEHQNSSFVVKGDADKLEQVLANLLTNAIKFTPSGTISFYSKYLEGKLHIEIRDTGIGMDEETLKRIFSPFERAAQNVNSEGFGLGLFLTKGLIKVLNGIIAVESAPGKGSIFKLEFPLPLTDELVEEDKPDNDLITILPKNVLVVDDDPILLKIAEDMLGRKGVSCTTCMNFQEVVAALGQSDYDMVLTDVQMPDTDGFALLRLLRNSDIGNSKTIPIAVMTARSDSNTEIYEKEGFVGCIHKPFNIHALLTFLSSVMSQAKVSDAGEFDYSRLLEGTDDNMHMLSLVVDESRKELEDLESALKDDNREVMRKTIHRMIPVWEMLGKEYLLRDFQERLHDMDSSDEFICEHAIQIIEWVKKLIEETEKELRKYENTDC